MKADRQPDGQNGTVSAGPDPLSSLAARLPDPQDREWYARLVSYIHSLPPTDELVKLAELFGFLTLMGRELPDAIAAEQVKMREFLLKAYGALQQEVKTNATYHDKLQDRLNKLPAELADGVKPEAIAKAMGESFRQQLTQTGLEETSQLLRSSVEGLKRVTAALDRAVAPIQNQYGSLASTIERQVSELSNTSVDLQRQNERLVKQRQEESWSLKVAVGALLFILGLFAGLSWQQRTTAALIAGLQDQVSQLQQAVKDLPATPAPPVKRPKKGE
jgi:hypothetical protein